MSRALKHAMDVGLTAADLPTLPEKHTEAAWLESLRPVMARLDVGCEAGTPPARQVQELR